MLRWLPFTVRRMDGYGSTISTFRLSFHSSILSRSLEFTRKLEQTSLQKARADPESLQSLRKFLSPANLKSSTPLILSADALKSMYLSVKQESLLERLKAYELSELLSLFGTLSIPIPRAKSVHNHDFASRMTESPSTPYWPFVLEIAQEREKRVKTLSHHHYYWVMRAHLARMITTDIPDPIDDASRAKAAADATTNYLRIGKYTADPEVHAPYFQAMLSMKTRHYNDLVAYHLGAVLKTYANPHSRLIDPVWQICLTDRDIRKQAKVKFLSSFWARLTRFGEIDSRSSSHQAPQVHGSASSHHVRVGLSTAHLCGALAGTMFPYFLVPLPGAIHRWALTEARAAFSPERPLEMRWNNLVVLALYIAPDVLKQGANTPSAPTASADVVDADWQTVFALGALEKIMSGMNAAHEPFRGIIRPLWRRWKDANVDAVTHRPLRVTRTIVTAFFRLAGQNADAPLKDGCLRFCLARDLFVRREGDTVAESLQTKELIVSYVIASLSCGTGRRSKLLLDIFSSLEGAGIFGGLWGSEVADALLCHLVSVDVLAAHDVYQYMTEAGISLSSDAVLTMGLGLASTVTGTALPFLLHGSLSTGQAEKIFNAILLIARENRIDFYDPSFASVLVKAMQHLYADRSPTTASKYSVQYALTISAVSGHASEAVCLIRSIHCRTPTLFSIHFLLGLMRRLVRCNQLVPAVRLLRILKEFPSPSVANFRRKLLLRLAKLGATRLASAVYKSFPDLRAKRTQLESLTRVAVFRTKFPPRSRHLPLQVFLILRRNPSHIPSIKQALSILVRAGRTSAAEKILLRSYKDMDEATKTWCGNLILHGALLRRSELRPPRSGRLVRRVLRTRDYLTQKYGFVQDRVTINILLKAILKWKVVGSARVMAFFDHMVRNGYPVADRWRHEGGVPFGTPMVAPATNNLVMQGLKPFISFERHVRPMYKMFIKAFYVRGDIQAAKTVVGILKAEEVAVFARRAVRRRARFCGLRRSKVRK